MKRVLFISGMVICAGISSAVTVSGQANIFGAGYGDTPEPGGGGGGVVPVEIGILGSPSSYTFSVTGTTNWGSGSGGPDGDSGSTNVNSNRSISDIVGPGRLFLVGVFLDSGVPASAPAILDFTGNTNFTTLSPELGQTFFIGDGLTGTGSGSVQQFVVPTGATRLFLGFADAFSFGGAPGWYGDNSGSLEVTANPVPEPATFALLGLGLLAARKRKKA